MFFRENLSIACSWSSFYIFHFDYKFNGYRSSHFKYDKNLFDVAESCVRGCFNLYSLDHDWKFGVQKIEHRWFVMLNSSNVNAYLNDILEKSGESFLKEHIRMSNFFIVVKFVYELKP